MIRQLNPSFVNVAPSAVATLTLPIGPTYNNIILDLGTGVTQIPKTAISRVCLKINGKIIYDITGSRLQTRNDFFGFGSDAQFLVIDFNDPKAKTTGGMYYGAIGTNQGVSNFTCEVTLGATAPVGCTLASHSWISPGTPIGVIRGLVSYPVSISGAGKWDIRFPFGKDAAHMIERVYFFHTGNMTALEVKKNGILIEEQVDSALNTFQQKYYGKVPQTNLFVYDPCVNNDMTLVVDTADANDSMYFWVTTSAADTINVYYEDYATLDRF